MPAIASIKQRVGVFEALSYRGYRLFWFGSLASVLGAQMLILTQGWLVYQLTGSKVQLGLVGLFSAVPSLVLTLFGGVVADKVDQRKLIIATQVLNVLVLGVLSLLTITHHVQVWHVMLGAFLIGGIGAFDGPSRQAIFPHLIERKSMMNAVALNSIVWQGTRIIGPAIGGVILGWVGAGYTYLLATVGALVFAVFLLMIRMPPVVRARTANVLLDMKEGLVYVRDNPIFAFLLGMVFFNSFFGMSYVQLMPVFQKDILLVDSRGLGLLLGMGGVGAFTGTFLVASVGKNLPKGMLILGGGLLFGAAIILFAMSRVFAVSLALVLAAGMMSSIYMIAVQSTLQMLVPDQFRGRVMGFWGLTYTMLPLGGFQAGLVANFMGAPFAVAIGGALVMAFAVLAAARNTHVRRLGA